VLPYGDAAVLFEPERPAAVPALRGALDGAPGVTELVAGARTLLVRFDATRTSPVELRRLAGTAAVDPSSAPAGDLVEIEVRYDGPDLEQVARDADLTADEVVARHSSAEYRVAFCGFAPGFAYLTGLDAALQQPRLREPRTRVPAGAVGIAGEFTGVYPRASPGGWRLLGTTDAPLWRTDRTPPALLTPGARVRFRPT
jgi:KipI family sensor histidine kinase inhibitor